MALTKKQVAQPVQQDTGASFGQAYQLVENTFEIFKNTLANGEDLMLKSRKVVAFNMSRIWAWMVIRAAGVRVRRIPPGASVMCFAEGTRSNNGKIKEFKKGGFVAAIEHKFPILPVTVNGSARILSKGSLVFYPGIIDIVVGDPIDTREYPLDRLLDLMNKVRDVIISKHHPGLVSKAIQTHHRGCRHIL
jgi:1-acyl-sn-glycerol-3-phosphate acyltransferase